MNQNRTNNIGLVLAPLLIVGIIVVGFLGWKYIEIQNKKLAIDAIQGCAQVGASSDPSGGFNGAVYQICMKDKGYETNLR